MYKLFSVIFLMVGTIIGAGFASGREISLFFAEFGYDSLFFLPIVFILFYYCFKLFLSIGSKNAFANILSLNRRTNSSVFFNIAIIVIFFVYSSAMFSASVEVLSNNFIEVPIAIFYALVFVLIYYVAKNGLKMLKKINLIAIPIIIVLLVIYSIYSIANPITDIAYVPSSSNAYILPISIIFYVFSNILLSCFILMQVGEGLTPKQIQKASFCTSAILCFIILICIFCLVENGAVVMDASMPFVVLTLRLGEPFPLIFASVLFVGIITSLFGCLHTLNSILKEKYKSKMAFISCLAVLLISLLGFENIVNFCYPIIGFFGMIMVFKILRTKSFFDIGFKPSNKGNPFVNLHNDSANHNKY
ncbi:MAG: hypothetical protein PHQ62_01725 [Clostridia bacterium]|nr:hypothetical protein [Clostridia bacterium]